MLKAISRRYVMADPVRIEIQHGEQQLLTELVLALADRGAAALDPMFARPTTPPGVTRSACASCWIRCRC